MDISIYLAKGVSLQEVMIKQNREQAAVINMIIAATKDPEFKWLEGKVGGGKDLFAEHRPQVTAWCQLKNQLARASRSFGEAPPLRDSETDTKVILNRSLAATGFNLLMKDLGKAVGDKGQFEMFSLSLYWHCWRETAGNVLDLMKSEELLKPQGLGVYSLK